MTGFHLSNGEVEYALVAGHVCSGYDRLFCPMHFFVSSVLKQYLKAGKDHDVVHDHCPINGLLPRKAMSGQLVSMPLRLAHDVLTICHMG